MASPASLAGGKLPASLLLDPKALKKQKLNGQKASQAPQPASPLDAKRLLNPKGFARNGEAKKPVTPEPNARAGTPIGSQRSAPPSTGSPQGPSQGGASPSKSIGQASLLERTYNVSHREERPVKRQKVQDGPDLEDEKKKATFNGNSSGELGEYVKQKRKEGREEAAALPSTVVDLTADDDGVEEILVAQDNKEKEVCYGRIEGAKVQAHAIPSPSPKAPTLSHNMWPPIKLSLVRHPGRDNIIRVLDAANSDFGNIDLRTSLALARIMDSTSPKFRTQARLVARKRLPTEVPKKEVSEYYDVLINLYGPKRQAISVGRWFGQRQVYLRTPYNSDRGVAIFNPHAPSDIAPNQPSRNGVKGISSQTTSGSGYVSRTAEEIRSDVMGMFDSMQQSEDLPEMEADPRVQTPLLSHQKQALHFLTNRERPHDVTSDADEHTSLWKIKDKPNGGHTYYNIITGTEVKERPRETPGGILADMMGLGKTLNMLALTVGSLKQAEKFGEQECPEKDGDNILVRNSKTTLIVAPLSTLANWEQQIQAHLKANSLSVYVYHGSGRASDPDVLAEYDVVITTYSIVASEKGRRHGAKSRATSPLFQTNFFRIILDEAHAIREQSTLQSQAICALSAERRWAVTGTPVQNRLEDLGGLIKFLRIRPFSDKGGFAQYILAPFKSSDPEVLAKLRLLVDTITLRRLKDRINLPKRHDIVARLEFTRDERSLYDWFAKDSQNRLRLIADEKRHSLGGRSYAHILRAILRLRLLCAHGRELLSEDDLKVAQGFNAETAIDLDAEDDQLVPTLSARQAYEMLMLLRDTDGHKCSICENRLEVGDNNGESEESNDALGIMLPCYHMICVHCAEKFKASSSSVVTEQQKIGADTLAETATDNSPRCPSCSQPSRGSFFPLTESGLAEAERARELARQNPRQAKMMGRYGGPHTKVLTLLAHLREAELDSDKLAKDEAPIKSVIFSGWTTYLDLIQVALEDQSIKHVRLDGKMSRNARTASLDAFRSDPSVRVILVSVGAGGLGLNLTTGSRVFMMEPQFNPAAEAQAVDRVHRLGQKRDVWIYRFIMRDSFEEKILELQAKKQDLANTAMNRKKELDKGEAARKKLEELRSLFK